MKTGSNTAFSELIKNYKFKNSNERDINPSKDMFTSWIQAVSIMRNICAHNSRIYNRSISTRPQLIYSDVIHPHPRYNGLYQIMLSMKYLRPTEDSWTAFITDFKQLLNNYSVYVIFADLISHPIGKATFNAIHSFQIIRIYYK